MSLRCIFTGHLYRVFDQFEKVNGITYKMTVHVISHCSRCGHIHHAKHTKG